MSRSAYSATCIEGVSNAPTATMPDVVAGAPIVLRAGPALPAAATKITLRFLMTSSRSIVTNCPLFSREYEVSSPKDMLQMSHLVSLVNVRASCVSELSRYTSPQTNIQNSLRCPHERLMRLKGCETCISDLQRDDFDTRCNAI